MTRWRRYLVAIAIALVAVPAPVAYAHGGTEYELTSNYRTRIFESPDIEGLTVEIIDAVGTPRLSWSGAGELIVVGYEGESYLRVSERGVERNIHSPATYLNDDRYARVELPAIADAQAEPEWETISDGRTAEWHDHRTHWMSPVPPQKITDDPDTAQMINARWEIPLSVNGEDKVVAGDLTWVPPPSTGSWLLVAAGIAIVAGIAAFSRWWRVAVTVAATFAAVMFVCDTAGYASATADGLVARLFMFFYPLCAVGATVRLWVHARDRTRQPTMAMMTGALLLVMLGGIDRYDALTNGYVVADGPAWLPRVAVVVCLGVGTAMAVRFLAFLLPLLVRSPSKQAESDSQPVVA